MARSLIASDDFNRANGNIGANWDYLRNTAWNANKPLIRSNVAVANNATSVNYQVCRWASTGTFTDDQYAKIKIGGLVFQSGQYRVGVVVRASADLNTNADYYGFNVWSDNIGNYTTQLIKVVNGTETVLNTASRAWANGDTLELEVVTNGSQVDLYCYKNGVAISGLNPLSDTASDRLLTGKPGILLGGDGSSSFATGDDWEAGNIGSGPPSTSTTPSDVAMAVSVAAPVVTYNALGTSVAPANVSIAFQAQSPVPSASTPVAPGNLTMGVTVGTPDVTFHPVFSVGVQDVTFAMDAQAPTASQIVNATALPGAGIINFSGKVPTARGDGVAHPPNGAVTFAGKTPATRGDGIAKPAAGSITFSGIAPTVRADAIALAGVGSVVFTGYQPVIVVGGSATAQAGAGSITFSGLVPTTAANNNAQAGVGSVAFSGLAATTRGDAIAQVAEPINIAFTGYPASTGSSSSATAQAAAPITIQFLGLVPAIATESRAAAAAPVSLTFSGLVAAMHADAIALAGAGSIVFTGYPAITGQIRKITGLPQRTRPKIKVTTGSR